MKAVFTSEEMRACERAYFAKGVSSLALMERAAARLSEVALQMLPSGGTCAFAVSGGGNGGDGYAAARLMAEKGARVAVITASEAKNPDTITNRRLAEGKVFALTDTDALDSLPRPALWVDCLFGTGLNRAPEGEALRLIRRINADRHDGSRVLSCDIPSGLSSDTGEIYGECVRADVTLTFHEMKRGHLIGRGKDVCGEIKIASIGIDRDCYPKNPMLLIEDEDVKQALPRRAPTAHKNDFGHLLIIAGSRGMAGAAAICASAAMRTGAGLVTVACPEGITNIIQTLAPCAMCLPLNEKDGAISAEALPQLLKAFEGKSAIAVGPGLSQRASAGIVEAVLQSGIKAVLDADALNLISRNPSLKLLLKPCHALTPHPGEAVRLLGEKLDAVNAAISLRALGCKALVKGAGTVIAGDRLYVSASGCAGMAKGGSRDALTGMVGALLAQGLDTETALWAGAQLHGRAGEAAAKKYGMASMLPTDLVSCIGEVYPNV